MNQPAVEFDDVTCSFVSDDNKHYTAVRDVNLTIGDGEFVSVVGPTGCGKSTVLNMAAGLLTPSKGTVKVFGEELVGLNKRAGYMFQAEALMPWRTAIDNVSAGLQFKGVPEKERHEQARHWLSRVGLSGFEDRYPHELSGGMRKRVALAQTLIMDPDIILMDEPSMGLSPIFVNEIFDIIREVSESGTTVLLVEQNAKKALSIADRAYVLETGSITMDGKAEDLLNDEAVQKAYLGE